MTLTLNHRAGGDPWPALLRNTRLDAAFRALSADQVRTVGVVAPVMTFSRGAKSAAD